MHARADFTAAVLQTLAYPHHLKPCRYVTRLCFNCNTLCLQHLVFLQRSCWPARCTPPGPVAACSAYSTDCACTLCALKTLCLHIVRVRTLCLQRLLCVQRSCWAGALHPAWPCQLHS